LVYGLAIIMLDKTKEHFSYPLVRTFSKVNHLISGVFGLINLYLLAAHFFPKFQKGFDACLCSGRLYTNETSTLYLFFYLLKILDLNNSLYLVLQEKPLTMLHLYHQVAWVCLSFYQLSVKFTPVRSKALNNCRAGL
jgi:hypothetical protein